MYRFIHSTLLYVMANLANTALFETDTLLNEINHYDTVIIHYTPINVRYMHLTSY